MKRNSDVFGLGLKAYLEKGRTFGFIERNDGYMDVNFNTVYFSGYKNWRKPEKKAMKYVTGRVADIGCGAGRHALYLQSKGFDVTGYDSSALAIKICRKLGLKKAVNSELSKLLMQRMNFNTVLFLGNNFGLMRSFSYARKSLKRLYKITPKECLIIAESMDPHTTNNRMHLDYHRANLVKKKLAGQVRIRVRFGNKIGPWFDYLFVSIKELRDIICNTGWRIKKILADKSPTYIIVLEKIPV